MSAPRPLLLATICMLCACGSQAELQPGPGQPLPVRPLLARTTPTPEDLLTTPTYANPQRIDELMRRAEPRRPDRFDLPPPDGGAAPVLPETDDPAPSEKVAPATPDEPSR